MDAKSRAERLVAQYSDTIKRVCWTYLRSTVEAEDICQEVFFQLLTNTKPFSSPKHEKAWIIRATSNRCKDQLKSAARVRWASDDNLESIPAPVPDSTSYSEELEIALDALTAPQRLAVHLFYFEGYNASEIADMTQSTPAAIHKHISRARNLLRAHLLGENQHA